MISYRASTVRLLVLTMNAWVAIACQPAVDVGRDATLPTLSWHVENTATNTATDFATNGKLTATKDDVFRVTLTAADPEGVRDIYLGGESSRNCSTDAIGQSSDALYAGQAQTLMPDQDGHVPTDASLDLDVTPDSSCDDGFTWLGTTIQLFGKGENYDNGASDGTLQISIRP